MLLGPPLCERDASADEAWRAALDAHVRGLGPLVRLVHGDGPATDQACAELARIARLRCDGPAEVACKRAALLFALRREPEVQRHFGNDPLAADLAARVLPLLTPRFLKHSCQAPEAYVHAALVLAELWEGEPLGNWPLVRGA